MGHLVMSGPQGTIARLADVPLARRLFIHINNTNPVWLPDSEARRRLPARLGSPSMAWS